MTDPILTDEEKGALLEGMSSGEIAVHSNKGPTYAEVTPFEIGPRSRLKTNSYPRLQSLNRQFAGRLGKQVELLLNVDSRVNFVSTTTASYSAASENPEGLSLIVEFLPKPLQGSAFITLSSATVGDLVETFYGGHSNDPSEHQAEFFTPGEVSVAALFGEAVLAVVAEVWAPMARFEPEMASTHLSTGVIDSIDGGDTVIRCEFGIEFGDKERFFQMLWPVTTVASLLPVFDGQKRDRDPAQDSLWQRSLRAGVTDSIVRICSDVGHTRMTLRAVADLKPGDVMNIGNPQNGTVSASDVPILAGRFGVHNGRYAVETMNWLESKQGSKAANSKQ
jgi:flagellar motor switch protein FliM